VLCLVPHSNHSCGGGVQCRAYKGPKTSVKYAASVYQRSKFVQPRSQQPKVSATRKILWEGRGTARTLTTALHFPSYRGTGSWVGLSTQSVGNLPEEGRTCDLSAASPPFCRKIWRVRVSQPSNCFRRLKKIVLPSIFLCKSFIFDDAKHAELSNSSSEWKNVTLF